MKVRIIIVAIVAMIAIFGNAWMNVDAQERIQQPSSEQLQSIPISQSLRNRPLSKAPATTKVFERVGTVKNIGPVRVRITTKGANVVGIALSSRSFSQKSRPISPKFLAAGGAGEGPLTDCWGECDKTGGGVVQSCYGKCVIKVLECLPDGVCDD